MSIKSHQKSTKNIKRSLTISCGQLSLFVIPPILASGVSIIGLLNLSRLLTLPATDQRFLGLSFSLFVFFFGIGVTLWWFGSLLLAIALQRVTADRALRSRFHRVHWLSALIPRQLHQLAALLIGLHLSLGPPTAALAQQPAQAASTNTDWAASKIFVAGSALQPTQLQPTFGPSTGMAEPPPIPNWTPSAPPAQPGLFIAMPRRPAATKTHFQVVRPGESLWTLTRRILGPLATDAEIAKEWPRWYLANRQLIGPDPDLLLPGQLLRPPAVKGQCHALG
ncbi:LysM peptidoglycan-binding domain-containing protein [Psychromicrobium lacuslunae]|uniref:LysM domain-containing protein n=1 Tax=Psychromicrobium lacuslunae TaxID=1618207 RepID=A0A0D4BZ88_9MICC|nr:hypothetical protein [Psychromicrobium lacuslunae]AJT41436.1 hypothetical protein UM93_07735 [Psychromicrobium lacuslunae]